MKSDDSALHAQLATSHALLSTRLNAQMLTFKKEGHQ